MANLQETSTWEAGIYQLETSDPVMGGENGIDNRAPRQLANRTLWLKNELARQIGVVNQSIANTNNAKADKAVQFTAGNGLTGGGDLSTSRTLSLGTPSKITATSTNTAVSNTHSHEIDKASTTTQGIVQLNDTLTSTATNQALTANQGKKLNDEKAPRVHRHNWSEIDGKPAVITNPTQITSGDLDNYKEIGVYYCEGNVYARDIANTPSNRAFALEVVRAAGVVQIFREYETAIVYMRAFYNKWSPWKRLATTEDNAPTATRLATARNIAITGDGSWNVNFDGSQNATGALTLTNSGVTAGSYNSVTVDAKGRVTAGLTQTHGLVTATTATGTANTATGNGNTFLNIVASGVGQTASVGSSTQITGTNGIGVSSDTTGKLTITQSLANNLTDASATKVLTALQGKILNEQKFDKAGGILTGGLYLHPSGLRSSADNDTGIDFPRDGVMRMIADGRERLIIEHGGTSLKTQDGIKLTLQNDKNLVVYDERNQPVFASNSVLSEIASKVNKAGDTMTGHLQLRYQNDWVGYSANNPTEGKNGYYDVAVNGIARGGMQVISRGGGRYDTIIGITPTGATTSDRRVGGLTVSQDGLHAHAYGHLHDYFVKTHDNQTISGIKTFSQGVITTQDNGFRIKHVGKNRSVFFRYDGDVFYLLKTPDGNPDGSWDDTRPFWWDTRNNNVVLNGNASTATKLQTPRQIALTGAVTGNVNFDGSGNVSVGTTLKAINRRDYTGTLTPSHNFHRTKSVSMTGSVEVLPDGRMIQRFTFMCPIIYFHRHSLRGFYIEKLGVSSFDAEDSTLLELPLWTAMPNKVQEARIHLSSSNNHHAFGEAIEWVYDWDSIFNHQANIKDKAYFAFRRWAGSADEPVTLNIIVEGY